MIASDSHWCSRLGRVSRGFVSDIKRLMDFPRTAPTRNFGGCTSVPICYEVQRVRRGNATHQHHGRRDACRHGRDRARTTRGAVSMARTAEPQVTDRTQVSVSSVCRQAADLKRLDQDACLQLSCRANAWVSCSQPRTPAREYRENMWTKRNTETEIKIKNNTCIQIQTFSKNRVDSKKRSFH